jgi:hypothetical protein
MTSKWWSKRRAGAVNREELVSVTRAIATILRDFRETSGANWLEERAARLERAGSDQEVRDTGAELHRIIPGMGGLTDFHFHDVDGRDGEAATAQLRLLTERLYQLTK